MIFERELPVGLFDLVAIGRSVHPQDFVVVTFWLVGWHDDFGNGTNVLNEMYGVSVVPSGPDLFLEKRGFLQKGTTTQEGCTREHVGALFCQQWL